MNKMLKMFYEAESMGGPIGGIFQLALVLHDAIFENQTTKTFTEVCMSKVNATINLDKLSRQLPYRIDHFIVFSSLACGRGNTEQSPYGYANSMMERICENRRRDGLHGLAIQWEPIGDVGVLVDSNIDFEQIQMTGLQMQRLPSWICALDKYLQYPYPVVASFIGTNKQLKFRSTEDNIIYHFWSSIGVDPKRIPNDVTLREIGMTSLLTVELQQRLERDYGMTFSIEEIKCLTVGNLKKF